MSFIVRQIARTADGREIVRSRAVDQAEISIGRGTENDIHLPDLAVTLHHAIIRGIPGGRIEIVAAAGLPFEVDGRSLKQAEIDPARGATIRIGSHALAISDGKAERADAIITVDRVEALSEASEEKDEATVFSLAGSVPGKRRLAWIFAALVLLAGLIWPVTAFLSNGGAAKERPVAFHSDEMWSSGKLSLVHASLENNCKACHAKAFEPVTNESCVACHTKIHDHADPRRLLAAKASPGIRGSIELAGAAVFGIPEGRCTECHTEHEGATAMPVTQQRFCSDCHGGLDKRLTDTKILNASDFGGDHPQFRPAIMTNPEGVTPTVQRISLDARPLEDNGLKFPHDIHLAKTGGVAQMARSFNGEHGFGRELVCGNCHVPDDSGARFQPVSMEKNCGMCHSLAFDRDGGTLRTLRHGDPDQVAADIRSFYRSGEALLPVNVGGPRQRPGAAPMEEARARYAYALATRGARAEMAVRAVFSPGGACFDCHKVIQPGVKGPNFGIVPVRLPDRYMKKGWFDHASHTTETCQSCHAAETSKTSADVLLPKIASCQTCHGGEGASKQVPSSCAMCHDYHMSFGTPLMAREDRARGKRLEAVKGGAG